MSTGFPFAKLLDGSLKDSFLCLLFVVSSLGQIEQKELALTYIIRPSKKAKDTKQGFHHKRDTNKITTHDLNIYI